MIEVDIATLERSGMTPADLRDARADVVRASHDLVRRFVDAESLLNIYAFHGEDPYDGSDLTGKLAHAEAFGNKYMDFRQGKPRSRQPVELPEPEAQAYVRLGEEVGMMGASDAHDEAVDLVLVNGSYKEGIYQRVILGRNHMQSQASAYPDHKPLLLGLAIERPLTSEDYLSAVDYAPDAQTEFDLMNGAIETQLNATLVGTEIFPEDPHGSPYQSNPGVVRTYRLPNGTVAQTLSAPRVEGPRLANTADTHQFAVQTLGKEQLFGAAILGTTAQVYEPFQRADMLRVWGLPYGVTVHMAGYRDPVWTQPAHIAQEANSFFDQGTRLLNEIAAAGLNTKE